MARGETNVPVMRFNNVHHWYVHVGTERSCTTKTNHMTSPRCHKVPKRQCYEQGHFDNCPIHGLPHSQKKECVQCVSNRKVQTKAEKEAREAEAKTKTRETAKTLSGFLTPQKERTKARTNKDKTKNVIPR